MDNDEGIYMSKGSSYVFEVVTQFLAGKVTRKEAATLLDVRERTVSRVARRLEKKGILGVVNGNRGRVAWNKTEEHLKSAVMALVEKKYFDFNMTHCQEKLQDEDKIDVGYYTLRRWCHEKGFVKRRKRRRGIARQRRERMPNEGLLVQMDGSPHEWIARRKWCLISTIDDATSKIPYAEFFDSAEDTLGAMKVLGGLIKKCGLPFALYVDKAHCFGGGDRSQYNQFKRACQELGIKVIPANSPEAKGRIERSFDTLQDRLVAELRINEIWTMEKANQYLRNKFLPDYWDRRLSVEPRNPESKYRPIPKHIDIDQVLCLKYFRNVNNDHTVSWNGFTYKLKAWPREHCIRGHRIEFRVYPDDNWKAFYADKLIKLQMLLGPKRQPFVFSKRTEFNGTNLQYGTA